MEEDYVIISDFDLATVFRDELKRIGISPRYTGVTEYKKFSKEELSKIERIRIHNVNVKDISWLLYCPNLRELSITSLNAKGLSTGKADAYENYFMYKAGITDFSIISQLKSLEHLAIRDDENLESLDLRGFDNLRYLELVGNHKLTKIEGLDSLKKLSELIMIKNGIKSEFDLKKMIDRGLMEVELDFDLYPMVEKLYPDVKTDIAKRMEYGFRCTWSENLSDLRYNSISTYSIDAMHQKAKEIINSIIGPDYSDIEKVAAIYAYITDNVYYDYEALAKLEKISILRKENKNFKYVPDKKLDRKQSSFDAILDGKVVCEGYSNMMHYLLKMVGVDSVAIHCSSDVNNKVVGDNSDHSVIKVEINGEIYYFDPTSDSQKIEYFNFFKTKDEFSINHSLSVTEEKVTSPKTKAYSDAELERVFEKVLRDKRLGINIIKNTLRSMETHDLNKTFEDYLKEYDSKIDYLQGQYKLVSSMIEELIRQNTRNQKLSDLMYKRNVISEELDIVLEEKRVCERTIKEESEKEHRKVINDIERLLGITITGELEYVYDNKLKTPRVVNKDKIYLRQEQSRISKMIEELYANGKIDSFTYSKMKTELYREYNELVKRAPIKTIEVEKSFEENNLSM